MGQIQAVFYSNCSGAPHLLCHRPAHVRTAHFAGLFLASAALLSSYIPRLLFNSGIKLSSYILYIFLTGYSRGCLEKSGEGALEPVSIISSEWIVSFLMKTMVCVLCKYSLWQFVNAVMSVLSADYAEGRMNMLLDSSATSGQANVRTERPLSPYAGAEGAKKAERNRPESGQTSQASPDVVSRISAVALETSRALTQAGQAADQSGAEESVRESERREPPPREPQGETTQAQRRSGGVNILV